MKNYKLTLEIMTPVHIGNGSNITKKDYEIRNGEIIVYDPIGLHKVLGREYENFLMNNTCLTDFLQRTMSKFKVSLDSAVKYRIKTVDKSIRKSDFINEFIKDPYGLPYIPGSSLKGVIRTTILNKKINDDPLKFEKYRHETLSKFTNSRDLEKEAFGEIMKSELKHLKISDSKPLSKDDLIVAKKIDVFKEGESNNKLNLCRETLKPKTLVEFQITVDGGMEKLYTKDYLLSAIDEFREQYENVFLSRFSSYKKNKYGKEILYIGGGTGFITKTIDYNLYQDEAVKQVSNYLDSQFWKHDHKNDIYLGISPRAKKCTKVNSEIMEMGICKVRID